MMASGAFMQVQSSLRWFVDNFSTIADWRATLLRVANFRRAVIRLDVLHERPGRIEFIEGEPGIVTIDDLEIASPAGAVRLEESHVEMKAGERVLVVGESEPVRRCCSARSPGCGRGARGASTRPKGESDAIHAAHPYFPPGTLREVLAYPSSVATLHTDARACMSSNGLASSAWYRCSMRRGRWESDLSDGEQQSLAFARALLHAPALAGHRRGARGARRGQRPRVSSGCHQGSRGTGHHLHRSRGARRISLFERVVHLDQRSRGASRSPRSNAPADPTSPRPTAVSALKRRRS